MKKVIIEFCREPNGTRNFRVYRVGEKKESRFFQSQYLAFSHAQTLYASQGNAVGVGRAA